MTELRQLVVRAESSAVAGSRSPSELAKLAAAQALLANSEVQRIVRVLDRLRRAVSLSGAVTPPCR